MMVTALLAASVAGDAPRRLSPRKVLFVGTTPADHDTTYAAMRAALDESDARWPATLRLVHIVADATDEAAVRRQLEERLRRERDVSVLVAPTGTALSAAWAMPDRPAIVFSTSADPRDEGIVATLRRPGGDATGVLRLDDLDDKRLELLRDAYPSIRRVRILADTFWEHAHDRRGRFATIARRLGLALDLEHVDTLEELDRLMHSSQAADTDAWYVPPTYIAYLAEQSIIDHLRRLGLPSIHATVREVERGAPLAYEQDTSFTYPAMAGLTLRVARGEKPSGIPIERPKQMVLAVRASGAAGPPVDPSLIRRADRVF